MSRFLFIVGKNSEFNKMGMDNLGRVIGPSAHFIDLANFNPHALFHTNMQIS